MWVARAGAPALSDRPQWAAWGNHCAVFGRDRASASLIFAGYEELWRYAWRRGVPLRAGIWSANYRSAWSLPRLEALLSLA